ncbi:MAG: hypothetical protein IPM92_10070 [Saprospiraceae bacterium]|nr:hypothetical protein [Saprospiraceae bacterium]
MADHLKDYIQKSREHLDRDEPRLDFKESLFAEIEKRSAQKRPWFASLYVKRIAIAASLCLLVICTFLIWQEDPKESNTLVSNSGASFQKSADSAVSMETTKVDVTEKLNEFKPLDPPILTKNNPSDLKSKNITNDRKLYKQETQKLNEDPVLIANLEKTKPTEIPQSNTGGDFTLPSHTETVHTQATEIVTAINPSEVKPDVPLQTIQEPAMESSSSEQTIAMESNQTQNVGSFIKKGVWGFLKKKARQITNNAIDIQSDESKEPTALALHFKSNLIEVQKTIPLNQESD